LVAKFYFGLLVLIALLNTQELTLRSVIKSVGVAVNHFYFYFSSSHFGFLSGERSFAMFSLIFSLQQLRQYSMFSCSNFVRISTRVHALCLD